MLTEVWQAIVISAAVRYETIKKAYLRHKSGVYFRFHFNNDYFISVKIIEMKKSAVQIFRQLAD